MKAPNIGKFKHLLEYFVAYLEFFNKNNKESVENDSIQSTRGYEKYIKDLIQTNNFKFGGQGYFGVKIQEQISEWEDCFTDYNIKIAVNSNKEKYKKGTLCWEGIYQKNFTDIHLYPVWDETEITGLSLNYFHKTKPESERKENIKILSIENLELFDGTENYNEKLEGFYNLFLSKIEEDKVKNI